MGETRIFPQPAALIPFRLRDRAGTVAVYYGANIDPVMAGFDAIAGLAFDRSLCAGYPQLHARIDYAGTGYRTICGWLQLVTRRDSDSLDPRVARETISVSTDMAPAFADLNLPFACTGNLPQFFDAPCMNLNDSAALTWVADTFLTTTPLRSRAEPVTWVLGFRWGYQETSAAGQRPTVLPLSVTGPAAWNAHLPFLRQHYPDWTFAEAQS